MPKADLTISQGNRKIKNANVFNLPVGTTCKPGVLCSKYCYSKKAERTYPGVRPARMRNYRASKKFSFPIDMFDILFKSKFKVTRIHEGGDFYSKEYIEKWYRIAELLPNHKFYAYTKRDDLFTPTLLKQKPSNLTLIYSIDGVLRDDTMYAIDKKGFDKVAVVRESKHNRRESKYNCPSTAENGWKIACIRDCKKCIDKKTIIISFARH